MDKAQITKWLVGAGLSVGAALSGGYLIVPHEGEVKRGEFHVAYIDAVGIPTICYGQTGHDLYGKPIKLGMKLTDEECMEMLARTVKDFEKKISPLVKVPYASDYQKASLISFTYNVGIGNLSSSTLLKKLNAGDHDTVCEELSKWVYAQKKKLNGLVSRREEEKQWCMGHVPYDAKVTYSQILDLVRDTTDKR